MRVRLTPAMLHQHAAAPVSASVSTLFRDGGTDSLNRTWACTRGSSLVRSPNGSLLAFFGGMHSCADGAIGSTLMMRASADDGASWGPIRVLHNFSGTSGYVAPTVDHRAKAVLLLFNVGFSQTWLRRSADDGATWSDAANLTDAVGGALALGPPGGVQLASGRLVLAAHAGGNFALTSEDGGTTWQRGGVVNFGASGLTSGGESQLVDTPARGPLALAMTVRVGSSSADRNHALVTSADGGATWGTPSLLPMMTGPTCQGSIARAADGTLLLSAPYNLHWRYPSDRRNLTVWAVSLGASAPGGVALVDSWQVWAGPAAYSSMTREGDFIMFEGGTDYRYQSVMVAPTGAARRLPHRPVQTWSRYAL